MLLKTKTELFKWLRERERENQLNDNYNLIKQKLQTYEDTIKNNQNPLDFPITHEELTNSKAKNVGNLVVLTAFWEKC